MDTVSVVCALAACLVFVNTWNGDFVYDDSRAIVRNQDLRPESPWLDLWRHDFWGTPLDHSGSHQSWRPLCVLSFRLNFHWSGLSPWSYHLVNIILHSLVTLCLSLLVRPLIRHRLARTLAGLTFAAHPIHCEAVASVVGRAELGMALHTLVALLAYRAHLAVRNQRKEVPSERAEQKPRSSLLFRLIQLVSICCCPQRKSQYAAAASGVPMMMKTIFRPESNRWKSSFYLTTALVAAGSAILWKETGAAALPLCAILELHQLLLNSQHGSDNSKPGNTQSHASNQKTKWSKNSLFLLGATWAGQLALRFYMLGGNGSSPWFAAADNPVAREASFFTRMLTFLYLPAFNLGLILWPAWLSFDWSMDSIRPLSMAIDPRNVATLLFYVGLAALARKVILVRRCRLIHLLGLALLVLPFLPAANLFFYVGFVVAERILYLPSAGFCFLLAAGLDNLMAGPRRKLVKVGLVITLTLFVLRTIQRNRDWADEEQLYRSGIPINPAKAYGNLAAILAREQRQTEAEHAYRQALAHRPNMAETHFNLALLLEIQGRHQEAMSSYLQSIHYRPNLAAAYINLGQLLIKLGRHDEAVHWLGACIQLDSAGVRDPAAHRHHQLQALIRWGQAEMSRGHHQRAIQLYKQALRRSPVDAQLLQTLYRSLGEAYESTGDFRESEQWFLKAVRQHEMEDGGDGYQQGTSRDQAVAAHLTYARFLAKNASRHEEAERLFRRAQRIAPTDPAVYMQNGQFLLDVSRPREAAESFVRAANLAPGDFEAVFNAAATLREVKELDRAEHYYRRAVQLRPRDVEVYRNLGALLHVKGQWREAEENYRMALSLSPDDRTTLTNLQRLHQLRASKKGQKTGTASRHPSES